MPDAAEDVHVAEARDLGSIVVLVGAAGVEDAAEHDAGDRQPVTARLADGEEGVVDGAERGARDDEQRQREAHGEVGAEDIFGVRDEQLPAPST